MQSTGYGVEKHVRRSEEVFVERKPAELEFSAFATWRKARTESTQNKLTIQLALLSRFLEIRAAVAGLVAELVAVTLVTLGGIFHGASDVPSLTTHERSFTFSLVTAVRGAAFFISKTLPVDQNWTAEDEKRCDHRFVEIHPEDRPVSNGSCG